MPTYEYACLKCEQHFDAFQLMRDEPFRECPKHLCRLEKWGHGKVKRLLGTGAGIIFKGSGFYTTDYRSDSYKEAAKKETPAGKTEDRDKVGKTRCHQAREKERMKTATPIQLTCPECRRDNEAERIYCHDCGARLDRSALAGRNTGKVETAAEVHKRMREMFSQRGVKARLLFFKSAKLIVIAFAAAALLAMLTAPEVPPVVKSEGFPPQINLNLETLTESHQPQTMQFSEEGVNAYLGQCPEAQKGKVESSADRFRAGDSCFQRRELPGHHRAFHFWLLDLHFRRLRRSDRRWRGKGVPKKRSRWKNAN